MRSAGAAPWSLIAWCRRARDGVGPGRREAPRSGPSAPCPRGRLHTPPASARHRSPGGLTVDTSLSVVLPICCGIDVHKNTLTACLLTTGASGKPVQDVRTFRTVTAQLQELARWLLDAKCPTVALESTGVYWKPVFNVLEPAGLAFNYPQVLNVFFRHWLWRPPGAAAPGVRRRHQPGFPAGNDPLAPASATCG